MFFDKITLSLADFILTNSEATKKHYIEKMGVRNKKIKCIPNAIDLKRFQNIAVNRKQKLKELGINSELVSLIVSVVARMEKQKGIPTIIKAFFEINKKHPQSFLLLIGHGKEKQNMIKLTSDLGIEKRVLFLEKRKDIPELLTLTDIFVLPSFNEGMSNALLEAMSLGKIIITSDIEENKELVRDGKNGLNFKAGDVRNLDKKLEYVINNHQTAKNLGKASLEKVKAKYKIEEVTKDYEKFLIEF
jgi:glycosyltransferase involved in cell wall biosynthesis